jgi:hypothetical protein
MVQRGKPVRDSEQLADGLLRIGQEMPGQAARSSISTCVMPMTYGDNEGPLSPASPNSTENLLQRLPQDETAFAQ